MNDSDVVALTNRTRAMTNEELKLLDSIARALGEYFRKALKRPRVPPNRVSALAAVEAALDWEKCEWLRE